MGDYHCIDIEFPEVDFNSYYIKSEVKMSLSYHAHIYTELDKIEVKIFFDDQTYFGEKLMLWSNNIGKRSFGSFLRVNVTKNQNNVKLQKVDLSDAKMIGCTNSSSYYENGQKYIIVRIDTAKFYWDPVEHEKYTAEFYLGDTGFRAVRPFYSYLSRKSILKNDGQFDISRMNDSSQFYKLGKSLFRPEFYFITKDDRNERVATITKLPKIQFKYRKGITEVDAILYGNVVLLITSFYHQIKIDYTLRRIHLPENTITIKNIEKKYITDTFGGLRDFGNSWDFNKFLQFAWQQETLKNYKLLSKVVELFNQAHLVDTYSSFLIHYNIIEICDKQKSGSIKFKQTLNKKETKQKYKEALSILLDTIETKEQVEFKQRWHNVQTLLQNKPMKNQLFRFLESQNLNPTSFPVKINELKLLRDNITHGSIENVNAESLREANILLYRISGILILNLMGIKEWKLNTEIN